MADDISFDLGKFFRKGGHEGTAKGSGAKVSWTALQKFLPVLLLLIPFLLAGYLRVAWLDLPQVEHWAENSVDNFYRSQIKNQVESQYPNLPPQNKQVLV